MTFPVLASNGPSGYNLSRSLRFRASASAYLSRTPASAGNRQKFTVSVWYKAGIISTGLVNANILSCGDGSSLLISGSGAFGSTVNDRLIFRDNGGATTLYWPMVFRDTGSWYHIVFAMDTTQATAANRAKLYVNGVDQGSFSGSAPAQNTNTTINSTSTHTINTFNGTFYPSDLYYAEYNFIDGQQLTASSFGSTNTLTGVWQPAQYTGTYGTNGFELQFTDNSALTTSSNVGLGKDFSGNGNYWTTNNISITAGVTYDSMTDVPTLTSATAANFAVMNPLFKSTRINGLSNGNLRITGIAGGNFYGGYTGTMFTASGKIYWEVTAIQLYTTNSYFAGGIATNNYKSTESAGAIDACPGGTTAGAGTGVSFAPYISGAQLNLNGSTSALSATYAVGDVMNFALDASNGNFWIGKNNTWLTGNPSTNTSPTGTITGGTSYAPWFGCYTDTDIWAINFGQRPFVYTPPAGFVALNTYNLPDSTIVKGNTVMDATLYTGNGSTQAITNAAAFRPDLVWLKQRNTVRDNQLQDSVRGISLSIQSNTTSAEANYGLISSLNSNGFTVFTNGTYLASNENGGTYVGWQWLESASAGFDIVTFTGNGGGQTFAHGLGVAPGLMICKSRNNAQDWYVYHSSIGGTGALSLNTTAATATSVNYWSNVTPGSGTFSVGGNFSNGYTYVNYLFAPIAGFSAFGRYTGNGSTDGPFVYLGFRPKFVMIKMTSSTGDWYIYDSSRDPYNATQQGLVPNSSAAETTYTGWGDFLSNGFKIRRTDAAWNSSGGTYIYAAFAENPFKNALAR